MNRVRPRGPGRPEGVAGFTMLEVLVALALISVVLLTMYQAFASSLNIHLASRGLWRAILYAENEMVAYERRGGMEVALSQGDFSADHPMAGYRWQREVLVEEPFPGMKVKKVIFTLLWDVGNAEQKYTAETYLGN